MQKSDIFEKIEKLLNDPAVAVRLKTLKSLQLLAWFLTI